MNSSSPLYKGKFQYKNAIGFTKWCTTDGMLPGSNVQLPTLTSTFTYVIERQGPSNKPIPLNKAKHLSTTV